MSPSASLTVHSYGMLFLGLFFRNVNVVLCHFREEQEISFFFFCKHILSTAV